MCRWPAAQSLCGILADPPVNVKAQTDIAVICIHGVFGRIEFTAGGNHNREHVGRRADCDPAAYVGVLLPEAAEAGQARYHFREQRESLAQSDVGSQAE